MPDDHDDDLDEDLSPDIRQLRSKAKRADAAEAERDALRRENALLKAGLADLTDAKQKALLAAHEGDETPESYRQTAIDLGFAQEATEPEPEPQVPAEEQAAHQRAQAATAGAEPAEAHPEKLDDLIDKAESPEELTKILQNAGIGVNQEAIV